MTDLHPDWQSTPSNTQGNVEPISAKTSPVATSVKIEMEGQSSTGVFRGVSRTPAAIVGVLIALGVGYASFGDWHELVSQLTGGPKTPNAVEVRITKDGPNPANVFVPAGGTIAWTNEDEKPHILKSQTLKGQDGNFLYTTSIFPQSRVEFTVAPSQPAGEYSYGSVTAPTLEAKVTVTGATGGASPSGGTPAIPATPTTGNAPSGGMFGGTQGIPLPGMGAGNGPTGQTTGTSPISGTPIVTAQNANAGIPAAGPIVTAPAAANPIANPQPAVSQMPPAQPAVTAPQSSSTSSAAAAETGSPNAASALPYNPYTVASTGQNGQSTSSAKPASTAPVAQAIPSSFYQGAPKQPDTGPAVWITGIISLIAMGIGTRKYLMRRF